MFSEEMNNLKILSYHSFLQLFHPHCTRAGNIDMALSLKTPV